MLTMGTNTMGTPQNPTYLIQKFNLM